MDEKEYLEEMEGKKPENSQETGEGEVDWTWEQVWLAKANELRCSVELAAYIYKLEQRLAEMDQRFEVMNEVLNAIYFRR